MFQLIISLLLLYYVVPFGTSVLSSGMWAVLLIALLSNFILHFSNLSGVLLYAALLALHISIGTEKYSLAQQHTFKLIKPGYMFQVYSHHQAYTQSLVELYMLNVYTVWGPSSEGKDLHVELKTWTIQWVKMNKGNQIMYMESWRIMYAACSW
jgi:hypothetical protein